MARTRRRSNRTAETSEAQVLQLPVPVESAPPAPQPIQEAQPANPIESGGLTLRQLSDLITAETAAYGLILFASFALRLFALGDRPLAEHEAAPAWAGWQFVQGQGIGTSPSPFLFTTSILTFALGAANDLSARLIPAIIGSLVVLLPLLVRRELGRGAALIASLLLLFSTSLVYFGRDLNGVEIGVIAGTAASIWLLRYLQGRDSRDAHLAAIAGAIALTSDAVAFTVLLGLIVALFIVRQNDRRVSVETAATSTGGEARRRTTRNAILLFVGLYLGFATAFMINREGLGAAFDLAGTWLSQFGSFTGVSQPITLLLLYEPLIFLVGLAGLISLPWLGERVPGDSFLLYFGCASLAAFVIYTLSGDKNPAHLTAMAIPLAILAAWFLRNLIERTVAEIEARGGWAAAIVGEVPILAVGLGISILFYLQFASLLTRSIFWSGVEAFRQFVMPSSPPGAFEPAALLLAILAAVIAFFVGLMAYALLGGSRTANAAAVFVTILLGLAGVRATWMANYTMAGPTQEPIAFDQTPMDVRDLVQELEWQSEWRSGDEHALAIQADPALGAVMHWYLRAFPNVDWRTGFTRASRAQAIVTAAGSQAPPGNWMSSDYSISYAWQLPGGSRSDLFKWLVFRTGATAASETAELWVLQPQAQ